MKDQPWDINQTWLSIYKCLPKRLRLFPKFGAQNIKFLTIFSRFPHLTPHTSGKKCRIDKNQHVSIYNVSHKSWSRPTSVPWPLTQKRLISVSYKLPPLRAWWGPCNPFLDPQSYNCGPKWVAWPSSHPLGGSLSSQGQQLIYSTYRT